MQTVTIGTSRFQAREEYKKYRKLVQLRKTNLKTDAERRQFAEDEGLRRANLEIARGYKVLDLVATMRGAGMFETGLPKLAIARADQSECFCRAYIDGSCEFLPGQGFVSGRNQKDLRIRMAAGVFPPLRHVMTGRAMVPSIPPSLRPEGDISRFHILWEAIWQKVPPVDPMLLKRLSANLFAVVATWDLTDLERAALNGRFVS